MPLLGLGKGLKYIVPKVLDFFIEAFDRVTDSGELRRTEDGLENRETEGAP